MRVLPAASIYLALAAALLAIPLTFRAVAGPVQESESLGGDVRSPWQGGNWRHAGPEMRIYICRYAKLRPAWCDAADRAPTVHPSAKPEVYGPKFTAADAQWHRLLRSADPRTFTSSDIELIRKRAEETGDPEAMEIMGYLHARGIGVPRDPEVAYIWYGRAFLSGETGVKANMDVLWDEMVLKDERATQRVLSYFESHRSSKTDPTRAR
jgi:TPR repeat protein